MAQMDETDRIRDPRAPGGLAVILIVALLAGAALAIWLASRPEPRASHTERVLPPDLPPGK